MAVLIYPTTCYRYIVYKGTDFELKITLKNVNNN
jgi:hypothetical protein